jgi:hypothetical protein
MEQLVSELVCHALGYECDGINAWLMQLAADSGDCPGPLALRRAGAHWAGCGEVIRDHMAAKLAISQPRPLQTPWQVPMQIVVDYETAMVWVDTKLR